VGGALAWLGLGLYAWARWHLRHYYATRVEAQADHQLIDSGPYRHVRHPTFTAFFLLVTALFLFNPGWLTLLIAVYTFWDFTTAARQEEKLLSAQVPGYADYMKRTRMFF